MRHEAIRTFLFLFLSVFIFNQVADYIYHHRQEMNPYCCELTEAEELNEIGSRLRSFNPSDLVLVTFHFNSVHDLYSLPDGGARSGYASKAFFPHALNVPIYLDKRTLII